MDRPHGARGTPSRFFNRLAHRDRTRPSHPNRLYPVSSCILGKSAEFLKANPTPLGGADVGQNLSHLAGRWPEAFRSAHLGRNLEGVFKASWKRLEVRTRHLGGDTAGLHKVSGTKGGTIHIRIIPPGEL